MDGEGGLTGTGTEPLDDEAVVADAAAQGACTDEWREKYPSATVPIATK